MAETATPEVTPGTIETTEEKPKSELEPGYLVICWNDPVNLMTYVTHVFQTVFGWNRQKAEFHMLQVHRLNVFSPEFQRANRMMRKPPPY